MCNHADSCHSGCEKFFMPFPDNAPFLKIAIKLTSNSFNTSSLRFHVIVHVPCQASTIRDQAPPLRRHLQIHGILAPTPHLWIVTHWITYVHFLFIRTKMERLKKAWGPGFYTRWRERGLKSNLKLNLSVSGQQSAGVKCIKENSQLVFFPHQKIYKALTVYNKCMVGGLDTHTCTAVYANKYPNTSS